MLELAEKDTTGEIASLRKSYAALYRENQILKEMVNRDGLTGLYNFRYLKERLEEEMERSLRHKRDCSLIMIDMDNLKQINDTLGHQAGNKVIKEIAQALKQSVRNIDVVARFGGDEFAVLLPDTDAQGALKTAERIAQKVRSILLSCPGSGRAINVTISAGIATSGERLRSADDLIHCADRFLYKAKMSGKNCVKCDDTVPIRTILGIGAILIALRARLRRRSHLAA
jgi:diguanylate cyclase (GGDEF)-like protein